MTLHPSASSCAARKTMSCSTSWSGNQRLAQLRINLLAWGSQLPGPLPVNRLLCTSQKSFLLQGGMVTGSCHLSVPPVCPFSCASFHAKWFSPLRHCTLFASRECRVNQHRYWTGRSAPCCCASLYVAQLCTVKDSLFSITPLVSRTRQLLHIYFPHCLHPSPPPPSPPQPSVSVWTPALDSTIRAGLFHAHHAFILVVKAHGKPKLK